MKTKILAALLVSLGLTGCVGITTVANTERISNPSDTAESGRSDVCPGKKVGEYTYCTGRPTKAEFRNAWGKPAAITKQGNTEEWQYNRDVAWRGAWIHAGVPIPLLVPAGINHEYLTFWREKLVERKSEGGGIGYQGMCSLVESSDRCFSKNSSALEPTAIVNGLEIGSHSQADFEKGVVADLDLKIPANQTWQVCLPTESEGVDHAIKVKLFNETFTENVSSDLCQELVGTGNVVTIKIGMRLTFAKPIEDRKSLLSNIPLPTVTFTKVI